MARVVQKDINNWPVYGDFAFREEKLLTFDGTIGQINTVTRLFTVTGKVIGRIYAFVETAPTSGAQLNLGTAGLRNGIGAAPSANLVLNDLWLMNTTPNEVGALPAAFLITNHVDIQTLTAQVTSGVIRFWFDWTPLTTDGNVVAA